MYFQYATVSPSKVQFFLHCPFTKVYPDLHAVTFRMDFGLQVLEVLSNSYFVHPLYDTAFGSFFSVRLYSPEPQLPGLHSSIFHFLVSVHNQSVE